MEVVGCRCGKGVEVGLQGSGGQVKGHEGDCHLEGGRGGWNLKDVYKECGGQKAEMGNK